MLHFFIKRKWHVFWKKAFQNPQNYLQTNFILYTIVYPVHLPKIIDQMRSMWGFLSFVLPVGGEGRVSSGLVLAGLNSELESPIPKPWQKVIFELQQLKSLCIALTSDEIRATGMHSPYPWLESSFREISEASKGLCFLSHLFPWRTWHFLPTQHKMMRWPKSEGTSS